MSARPFRVLCPEADERDGMDDGAFWERVARNLGAVPDFDPDDVPDDLTDVGPCPLCGESGACMYDVEGRPLIHAVRDEDGVS